MRLSSSTMRLQLVLMGGTLASSQRASQKYMTSGSIIGRTISHYRVLSELGSGAMGIVYLGEDLRLGRRVALKLAPESGTGDPRMFQRLQREARSACMLNHPNICTVYDIEECDGRPVIVMELLEGQTLKERLASGPIDFPTAVALGIEIAGALTAAHQAGLIHRDIKPANIFLTSAGAAKILDFGLAKLLVSRAAAAANSDDVSLTAAGVIPGTAAYMSPEQVRGEELDGRSDIFSFGVVFYEMVTGKQPFRRNNVPLAFEAILHHQPPPASDLNSIVPHELDLVLQHALSKQRDRRYESAAEMRDDLCNVRDLLAQHAPSSPRSRKLVASTETSIFRARRRRRKLVISAGIVLLLLFVGPLLYLRHRTVQALSTKDTILLADFENKTGDPVFDDTLKQALSVDFGQSPFLNLVSERKIAATLRLMGRSPDQLVTGEVAREVCQRVSSKAMLGGAISSLGNEYVLRLNAIDCATGESLVKRQVEAHSKESVLEALGSAAKDMRSNLGESLASVQKSATPIEEATTSSLDALKAYSMGRRVAFQKGDAAALPYLQRAVELDPKFALAYRALAIVYINLGQTARVRESATKAFELRHQVSERERYLIESTYYSFASGELEKANQVCRLWKQSYPRDFQASGNLGNNYALLGQWEQALAEIQESLRLEPNIVIFNADLAQIQMALNRTEEARATIEQARAHALDSHILRLFLYQAAFLQGDEDTIKQQLVWAAGRVGEEDWLLSAQSDTEAYRGRLAKAREFSQLAEESALRADEKETAALWQADAALREAEFGNGSSARQNAVAALEVVSGKDVRSFAALALARAGDIARARKVAYDLNKEFPQDTLVQGYWLPSIYAAVEIAGKHAPKAIDVLRAAAPYELGQAGSFQLGTPYPIYLRGEAYLQMRRGKEAGAEFQKMIDHRGIVVNFPLGALANLGLARAYALQHDTAKARSAYQEFLAVWKDADADIPVLREAKAEYAAL